MTREEYIQLYYLLGKFEEENDIRWVVLNSDKSKDDFIGLLA